MEAALKASDPLALEQKYRLETGRVLMSGVQALVLEFVDGPTLHDFGSPHRRHTMSIVQIDLPRASGEVSRHASP